MQEQQKQWQWKPDDQFTVSGALIQDMIHLVQGTLSTPEAQKFLLAIRADEMLGQVLNKGIQDGIIKEKVEENVDARQVKESPVEKWLREEGIEVSDTLQRIEVSSINPKMIGLLTDRNHFSQLHSDKKSLSEILGWEVSEETEREKDTFGLSLEITRWAEDPLELDEEGRPKDLIVFVKNGGIRWIPKIEFDFLLKFKGSTYLTWGYIDGRRHHLGFGAPHGVSSTSKHPEYEMWVEGDKNSEIAKSNPELNQVR